MINSFIYDTEQKQQNCFYCFLSFVYCLFIFIVVALFCCLFSVNVSVEWLILDEADRLFDMGFLEQVDTIMSACNNPKLKRALFSATMQQGVEHLARTVCVDPIRMTVGAK